MLLLARLVTDFVDSYLESVGGPSRTELHEQATQNPLAYVARGFGLLGRPGIYLTAAPGHALERRRRRLLLGLAVFLMSAVLWFVDTAIVRSHQDIAWFKPLAGLALVGWISALMFARRPYEPLVFGSALVGVATSLVLLVWYP